MRNPHSIILRPVLTEKAMWLQESQNQFTFEVPTGVNKIEIKQALHQLYPDLKVLRVNTMMRRGKQRRMRLALGRRADTKRAIVTVAAGQSIDLY
jgi:large subunit ribosomal protein L23